MFCYFCVGEEGGRTFFNFFLFCGKQIYSKGYPLVIVIVKDQSSHLMYLNTYILDLHVMHKITNLENLNSFGSSWSCEIIIEEKTPLSHEVVCFQMLDLRPQILIRRIQTQIRGKLITSFSKTTLLQMELFLTICYTINSSPLRVTK